MKLFKYIFALDGFHSLFLYLLIKIDKKNCIKLDRFFTSFFFDKFTLIDNYLSRVKDDFNYFFNVFNYTSFLTNLVSTNLVLLTCE